LADRIRVLRAEGHPNGEHIQPIEAQTSLKWQELRLLRAGPINSDQFLPELGLPNRRQPRTITALARRPVANARAADACAALTPSTPRHPAPAASRLARSFERAARTRRESCR
jgi:hypothetical protein